MDGAKQPPAGGASEAELHRLHDRYLDLADKLHRKGDLTKACSVEETETGGHASPARRIAHGG